MTPYKIFTFCQNEQGRKTTSLESFEKSDYYNYFVSLTYYFYNELKFENSKQIKTFIKVCATNKGSTFDPYQLKSPEYLEIFNIWYRKNGNIGSYYQNIQEGFRNIYLFCVDKNIESIEKYISNWGVSHIVSGLLNEDIAYSMGLHTISLTNPEKHLINKKFLKNVQSIKNRIHREEKLKRQLHEGLEDLKKKLIWKREAV